MLTSYVGYVFGHDLGSVFLYYYKRLWHAHSCVCRWSGDFFIFRSIFNRVYIVQASPLACQLFAWCSVVDEIWRVCSSIDVKYDGMPIKFLGAGLSSVSSDRCIYRFAIMRV